MQEVDVCDSFVNVSVAEIPDWQHAAVVMVMVFCSSPVSIFIELRGMRYAHFMARKIPANECQILFLDLANHYYQKSGFKIVR